MAAHVNYALAFCPEQSSIINNEPSSTHSSVSRLSSMRMDEVQLEEEICDLRVQMEELFLLEQSLTSPVVIAASLMLDSKINEYMQLIHELNVELHQKP